MFQASPNSSGTFDGIIIPVEELSGKTQYKLNVLYTSNAKSTNNVTYVHQCNISPYSAAGWSTTNNGTWGNIPDMTGYSYFFICSPWQAISSGSAVVICEVELQ